MCGEMFAALPERKRIQKNYGKNILNPKITKRKVERREWKFPFEVLSKTSPQDIKKEKKEKKENSLNLLRIRLYNFQ